jgi:hypothetical protein
MSSIKAAVYPMTEPDKRIAKKSSPIETKFNMRRTRG